MAKKNPHSNTIRIDLQPDLQEKPRAKRIVIKTARQHKTVTLHTASTASTEHPAPWGSEFQELFHSVYDGAVITQPDGQIIDVNNRTQRFLLYSHQELCALSILDVISCSDQSLLKTILDTLQNEKHILIQAYCTRKDGTHFPSEISVSLIRLSENNYLCFFVRDTTLRENAEELRKQMQFIINRSHSVAFRIAPEASLRVEYISDNISQFGFTSESFMSGEMSLLDLIHPDDAPDVVRTMLQHARSGEEEVELEFRITSGDAACRWVHLQGWYAHDDEDNPLYCQGVFMDISERKHIEEERALMEIRLRQAQKLESMGQLAAGIAHEINTPTQFVGDSIHFLQSSFGDICTLLSEYDQLLQSAAVAPPSQEQLHLLQELNEELDLDFLRDEIPHALERSLKGIKRIADIVLAMKEFSHPGGSERSMVDINKTIENALIVAKNEWKYVADIETSLDSRLPLIRCIPGEINQVILNIIVNAAQAVDEALGKSPDSKGTITIRTAQQDNQIRIDIGDTGCGISDELKSRIFDPFFTTKEVGKGTGQGLTIAYNIVVNRHGGTISFASIPDQGTTVTILLPVEGIEEEDSSLPRTHTRGFSL